MQQAPPPPLVDDSELTLVNLKYTPNTNNLISFADGVPAGHSQSELDSLNLLARILASVPQLTFPPPPQTQPNPLSAQIAKAKEEGNNFYKIQKWAEAARMYTLSADMAASRPVFEANVYARDELAIALCNRSAAYMNMGEWINALVDADAVIQLKRPWVKGYFRKGKALQGMGRLEEALEALLLGLQFDPKAEDLDTAAAEVRRLLKEKEAAKQEKA